MNTATKVQLAMAVAGLPLLLYIWKPDAKWPNPLALDTAKRSKDK